jgi:hypothetical protein
VNLRPRTGLSSNHSIWLLRFLSQMRILTTGSRRRPKRGRRRNGGGENKHFQRSRCACRACSLARMSMRARLRAFERAACEQAGEVEEGRGAECDTCIWVCVSVRMHAHVYRSVRLESWRRQRLRGGGERRSCGWSGRSCWCTWDLSSCATLQIID